MKTACDWLLLTLTIYFVLIFNNANPAFGREDMSGVWQEEHVEVVYSIEQWGSACGQTPRSIGKKKSGKIFTVEDRGVDLLFTNEAGRKFSTGKCQSSNPKIKAKERSSKDTLFMTNCATEETSQDYESGLYSFRIKSKKRIDYRETTRFSNNIEGNLCVHTKRVRKVFTRQKDAPVAEAPKPKPAEEPPPEPPQEKEEPKEPPVKIDQPNETEAKAPIKEKPEKVAVLQKSKETKKKTIIKTPAPRKPPKKIEEPTIVPMEVEKAAAPQKAPTSTPPKVKPDTQDWTPIIIIIVGIILLAVAAFIFFSRKNKAQPVQPQPDKEQITTSADEPEQVHCTSCGKAIPADAKFCPYDRTPTYRPSSPTLHGAPICPTCKRLLPAGAKFCPYDRTKLG
jgi:RNA polymerase subunit RPABC4/transcription elongation factor Spt4